MITEAVVSLVVVTVFIVVYYLFTGIPPGARLIEQEPPSETSSAVDEHHAKLMMFSTSWCPYCKKAEEPWKSLQQLIKNTDYTYGGYRIIFEEVDCDVQKGRKALYNIKAYPTFKVQTKDKLYEMVGAPTVSNFRDFLEKALGDEKSSH